MIEQRELWSQAESRPAALEKPSPIRWAMLLPLGIGLTALDAAWMTYMELAWNQGYATLLSLYYNVVFSLVLALVGNAVVRRVWPRAALTQPELLLLFVMGTIGTSLAMLTEYLMSSLAFPYQYLRLDSRWSGSLLPFLPRGLTVSDAQAVKDYYLGQAVLWRWSALRPWLLPFVGWGIFLLALVWTGICLSALVYDRWRHQEKMPFPLVQIPVMLTEPKAPFLRSGLFWLGFLLAGGVDFINLLHWLYPSIPMLPVKRAEYAIPGAIRPWDALNPIYYSLNPFLIGLEFFLPLDLLFSVFVFYWAGRMQGVLVEYWGSDLSSSAEMVAPYVREQAFGALMALLLYAFWRARGQLRRTEDGPPRKALTGAALGAAVMIGVLCFGGMSLTLACLIVLVYLAVALSLARIRAQYGPPAAGLLIAAPGPILYSLIGRDTLGTPGLSGLAWTHWLGREFSNNPLSPTVEGMALREQRVSRHALTACILVSAAVGYAATFGTALITGYALGHGTAHMGNTQFYFGNEAYMLFSSHLSDRVGGPHLDSLAAMGLGGGLTLLLQSLRSRFVGFPLHPVGYAIASTYSSAFLWSTALITWLFKVLLMRYAGLKGYHRAAPFFLGLLLGEFVVGSSISLLGIALGKQMYVFWPY
ncbi:MAG TPA: DUF6785 family protein [Chthonomonadaceae bacterium]|nr:DUF6785 family protein [Chthonomonadaceae bacterium]